MTLQAEKDKMGKNPILVVAIVSMGHSVFRRYIDRSQTAIGAVVPQKGCTTGLEHGLTYASRVRTMPKWKASG